MPNISSYQLDEFRWDLPKGITYYLAIKYPNMEDTVADFKNF